MISMTYILRRLPVSRPCPVEILGSRASPRQFNFDTFVEPTVFAFSQKGLGARRKQAADLTPQLAASLRVPERLVTSRR
jgi:hypothetical protein